MFLETIVLVKAFPPCKFVVFYCKIKFYTTLEGNFSLKWNRPFMIQVCRIEKGVNKSWFLTRNSVAVSPAFAQCTKRCTRRKVTTSAECRKWRKQNNTENRKTNNNIVARCSSSTLANPFGGARWSFTYTPTVWHGRASARKRRSILGGNRTGGAR